MTPLLLLAEKVEGLEGPDREVDILIKLALGLVPAPYERAICNGVPQMYFWDREDSHAPYVTPERYTSSVDAAMSLIPTDHTIQLSDWDHEALRAKGPWQAIVLPLGARGAMKQFTFSNRCDHAATAPLALVVASLRARAAMEAGE